MSTGTISRSAKQNIEISEKDICAKIKDANNKINALSPNKGVWFQKVPGTDNPIVYSRDNLTDAAKAAIDKLLADNKVSLADPNNLDLLSQLENELIADNDQDANPIAPEEVAVLMQALSLKKDELRSAVPSKVHKLVSDVTNLNTSPIGANYGHFLGIVSDEQSGMYKYIMADNLTDLEYLKGLKEHNNIFRNSCVQFYGFIHSCINSNSVTLQRIGESAADDIIKNTMYINCLLLSLLPAPKAFKANFRLADRQGVYSNGDLSPASLLKVLSYERLVALDSIINTHQLAANAVVAAFSEHKEHKLYRDRLHAAQTIYPKLKTETQSTPILSSVVGLAKKRLVTLRSGIGISEQACKIPSCIFPEIVPQNSLEAIYDSMKKGGIIDPAEFPDKDNTNPVVCLNYTDAYLAANPPKYADVLNKPVSNIPARERSIPELINLFNFKEKQLENKFGKLPDIDAGQKTQIKPKLHKLQQDTIDSAKSVLQRAANFRPESFKTDVMPTSIQEDPLLYEAEKPALSRRGSMSRISHMLDRNKEDTVVYEANTSSSATSEEKTPLWKQGKYIAGGVAAAATLAIIIYYVLLRLKDKSSESTRKNTKSRKAEASAKSVSARGA